MRKLIKSVLKNMIFYAIILGTIFIISKVIVNNHNMEFRIWFYIFLIVIIAIFFIIGVMQIISKINSIVIKSFVFATFFVFIFICSILSYFFYNIFIPYENVVKKQGEILVEYQTPYVTTNIMTYYNYVNFILRGKDIVLHEELDD